MTLAGYVRADFTAKDGRTVNGYNVYLTAPAAGPEATGLRCDRIYVSARLLATLPGGKFPPLGTELGTSYNKFGKLQQIWVIKPAG